MLAKLVAGIDYLVPFLDIGFIFFWVPGVILFLFGYPLIFAWWSMLLLPITLVIFGFLRRWQEHHVFRTLDIHLPPTGAASWATCSSTRCSPPQPPSAATASTSSERVATGNEASLVRWARLGSNQRPLACEASALPLSYAPGRGLM